MLPLVRVRSIATKSGSLQFQTRLKPLKKGQNASESPGIEHSAVRYHHPFRSNHDRKKSQRPIEIAGKADLLYTSGYDRFRKGFSPPRSLSKGNWHLNSRHSTSSSLPCIVSPTSQYLLIKIYPSYSGREGEMTAQRPTHLRQECALYRKLAAPIVLFLLHSAPDFIVLHTQRNSPRAS